MNLSSELIFLHDAMARLCKLYIELEKETEAEDLIQEVRTEIADLYSEIVSITKSQPS